MKFHLMEILLALLLLTSLFLFTSTKASKEVLIISNDYDMKAADLLKEELSKLNLSVEISSKMNNGYNCYFILGGPLAKDVGRVSKKYLPSLEIQALIGIKGYWTFVIKPEKSQIIVIAGNTRKETFSATKSMINEGIIRFIMNKSISMTPPLSPQERRNLTTLKYEWRFPPKVGKEYNLSLQVPLPLVDFFKVKPRMRLSEFNKSKKSLIFTWYLMVRTPHDDPYISTLVRKLNDLAEKNGIEGYNKLWFIASFVQSMKYSLANEFSPTGDYPSYPIETLYRGAGDCEDLSILLISLYRQAGYNPVLLIMPTHAAVAVSMPPKWVKLPKVKYRTVEYGGTPIVLINLIDLQQKLMKGRKVALEFNMDGEKYYYVETTAFFKPGVLPDLAWLANEIGWNYSEFPVFVVKMNDVAVPLIANYTIVSRKVGKGYGITVVAKVANIGERGSVDLRLNSQIYPLSKVKVGGNDPHLVRLGKAGNEFLLGSRWGSYNIGEIGPGDVKIVSMNFYTGTSEMGASISVSYQGSDLDFIRMKPFHP